jgi:23S rRNA pseudouridine955/2504/2580 synthase
VAGSWPASRKVIDVPLHKYLDADGERRVRTVEGNDDHAGRRSITQVKVVRSYEGYTLLDVTIKTGRTHQIRVHLAHVGMPVVGDDKYGDFALNRDLARDAGQRFQRMFLHARRLAFDHPVSGERVILEAPLPSECVTLLRHLIHPH